MEYSTLSLRDAWWTVWLQSEFELRADEALVLHAWISRFNKREDNEFEDRAEQGVLWDVESLLDESLVASSKTMTLVTAARDRVRVPRE